VDKVKEKPPNIGLNSKYGCPNDFWADNTVIIKKEEEYLQERKLGKNVVLSFRFMQMLSHVERSLKYPRNVYCRGIFE
jgi:hypothetical protein